MPGVGTLAYGNTDKPYQVTMLTPTGTAVPVREQSVTYTSFQRPNTLTENGITASFVYNADGDRVKMHVAQGNTALLTRYYIGKQYELDAQTNTERLYLGGDAYSAPAVYVKEANVWKIYYLCRDYLGSITHIANADGSLKQELSYNAWGRLRNPATQVNYAVGSEPALFLGRGYTGHEHLAWLGLINMNARLYDPVLGRFLSPDPYVGNPFLTQFYNRYTYAINNPLVYIDQTGEDPISWITIGVIALFSYLKAAHDNTPKKDQGNPGKWNWLPWKWDWKNANYAVSVGNNTGPSGGAGGAFSVGWDNNSMINIGYNQKSGPGIGVGQAGTTNMYYPQYDYNKPEKAAMAATQDAVQTFFSFTGVTGSFLEKSNATFRITNGVYNGSQFSPKIYNSGWKGGSVAKITTYSLSNVGRATSLGSGIITTGYAYNEIITNPRNTSPITYVDAGVGTAGILSSAASYYTGVQIPYVGEAVVVYGTLRLTWDVFFYLGGKYGPSKWYGKDDTKWFK